MKISVVTGGYTHFFIRDLCELIDYYADLGYTALDLSLDCAYDSDLLSEEKWIMPAKRIKQRLKMSWDGIRFDDLLCAGDVARTEGSAHFDGEKIRRHRQVSSWLRRCGPERHCP